MKARIYHIKCDNVLNVVFWYFVKINIIPLKRDKNVISCCLFKILESMYQSAIPAQNYIPPIDINV